MIQAYSQNITVNAMQAIPFNSVSLQKGCTATQNGATTFNLNKCGVYEVSCGVSAAATETIQLYKDGVPVAEARRTGNSPNFTTLVQVNHNNCPCDVCDSPTTLQVMSVTAATLADASIVISKLV